MSKGRVYYNDLGLPFTPRGEDTGVPAIKPREPLLLPTQQGGFQPIRPGEFSSETGNSLANTVKFLWETPANVLAGKVDPRAVAPEYALGLTALGLGVPMPPGALGMGRLTYHGTGARFEKFADEAIGSGQGAQSYGWGHYVAGAKPTAEQYQRDIGGQPYWTYHDPEVGVASLDNHLSGMDWEKKLPGAQWDTESLAKYNALSKLRQTITPNQAMTSERFPQLIEQIRKESPMAGDWLEKNQDKIALKEPGHLLEVHVLPEEHEMLDWDHSLLEHPVEVHDKLKSLYKNKFGEENSSVLSPLASGETIYRDVARKAADADPTFRKIGIREDQELASKTLHEAGIPGIKYLDALSRNQIDPEKQTRNYVIFHPDNLRITARDGQRLQPVDYNPFEGEIPK